MTTIAVFLSGWGRSTLPSRWMRCRTDAVDALIITELGLWHVQALIEGSTGHEYVNLASDV